MQSSTIVPHTSTSQLSEGRRRLACAAVPESEVTRAERDEMYRLLQRYFAGTDRARFETDLREKGIVILLRDAATERIQGFSTLMRIDASIDGKEVVAFFSGDTIVDREYWGETALSRIWGRTVFDEADRIAIERPAASIYWFLLCSGYKTWRFLPVFFKTYYPNAAAPMPPHVRRILDALGSAKFGDEYLPEAGIVRFRAATPLRRGVADVTDGRLRDPGVAFFARANPGHVDGDELACLAELSRSNLTPMARRMIARPL